MFILVNHLPSIGKMSLFALTILGIYQMLTIFSIVLIVLSYKNPVRYLKYLGVIL